MLTSPIPRLFSLSLSGWTDLSGRQTGGQLARRAGQAHPSSLIPHPSSLIPLPSSLFPLLPIRDSDNPYSP